MRRLLNVAGGLLGLLVFGALIVAFALVVGGLQKGVGPLSGAQEPTQAPYPPPGVPASLLSQPPYPPPEALSPLPPQPFPTCDAPWPTPPAEACPWLPSPTPRPTSPFLTRTPWVPPTPQVPAPTPLAPFQAAESPAGDLLYRGASFQSFSVDEEGNAAQAAQRLDFQPAIDVAPGYDFFAQFDRFAPSPHGKYVVAVAEVESGEIVIVVDTTTGESTGVNWSNAEGRLISTIGFFYGWHPNGYEFLFREDNAPDQGLWLVDASTGQHRLLAQPPTLDISGAAISPDGQRLVYATNTFEVHQIWAANANGSEPRLLLESDTIVYIFSWSPDGHYLLYIGEPTPVVGKGTPVPDPGGPLWVMNAEGQDRRPLSTPFIFGFGFAPAWSPAGHHIASVGGTDESAPCWQSDAAFRADPLCWFRGTGVYVEDVDAGEVELVARNAIDPAWSPDGSLLGLSRMDEREQVDIWLVRADGYDLRPVTDTPELDRHPIWMQH